MNKYRVTVHFRYVSNGEQEKDFDVYTIEADSEANAEYKSLAFYGSKYLVFRVEVEAISMTKEMIFNLTSPVK